MKIVLDIEEEDIDRIVKALDNQYAYLRSRDREDSGYKRLADNVSPIFEAGAWASRGVFTLIQSSVALDEKPYKTGV